MAETNPNPAEMVAGENPAGEAVPKRSRNRDIVDAVDLGLLTYVTGVRTLRGEMCPPPEKIFKSALERVVRMKPRDAVEELLISQMLITHARIMSLARRADAQMNTKWAELMYTAADRAANTFRRQMETLAKYRRPRRRNQTSITTIRTAHINAKQILAQSPQSVVQPHRAEAQAQEEADAGAQGATAGADSADQTVAEEHGPKNLPG